jgi:hypothetical protein
MGMANRTLAVDLLEDRGLLLLILTPLLCSSLGIKQHKTLHGIWIERFYVDGEPKNSRVTY